MPLQDRMEYHYKEAHARIYDVYGEYLGWELSWIGVLREELDGVGHSLDREGRQPIEVSPPITA